MMRKKIKAVKLMCTLKYENMSFLLSHVFSFMNVLYICY